MRIVIKTGTSTLAHTTGRLNIKRTNKICQVISDLKNEGHEIILVSSGAIAMGVGKLLLTEKPKDIPTKQAAAAVGQCELMYTYDRIFKIYNHTVAQMLITKSDFDSEERHINISNTLSKLLELNVLPIINENDTIATDEIKVGDNDTLSAYVATSAKADLLIILSDINGLYSADPRKDESAVLIPVVDEITEEIKALGGGKGSSLGTGGMHTKLNAAEICTKNGIDMIITNGSNPEVLYDIADGKQIGTRFIGK
jgi:glutamate 5-kinase